jgi:ABC-type sugar transport system substrate-binding protein
MKKDAYKKLIIILVLFVAAGGFLFAAPQQEEEEDQITIGVVYRTLATAYWFNSQQYQGFYRAESRLWNEKAEEEGFNLIEIEGGVYATQGLSAVDELITNEVDAIYFYFNDPAGVTSGIRQAQEEGIPVVVSGIDPAANMQAPYVGFEGYEGGRALGEATADLFRKTYPERLPRLLVVNTEDIQFNTDKERGFLEGFTSILTATEVVRTPADDGTIRTVMDLVTPILTQNQDINVVFASNDFRALGVVQAVESATLPEQDDIILASMGGSENAFEELMDPASIWRAQAGYRLGDMVDAAYEMLMSMLEGDTPIRNSEETKIDMEIFTDPSTAEVEEYLLRHHRITEPDL